MGLTVDVGALVPDLRARATIANDAAATDPTSFVGRPGRAVRRALLRRHARVGRLDGRRVARLVGRFGPGRGHGMDVAFVADRAHPRRGGAGVGPVPDAGGREPQRRRLGRRRDGGTARNRRGRTRARCSVAAGGVLASSSLPLVLDASAGRRSRTARSGRRCSTTTRPEIGRRVGTGGAAEANYWKLLHRHRLSPMHDAETAAALQPHLPRARRVRVHGGQRLRRSRRGARRQGS